MTIVVKIAQTAGWLIAAIFAGTALKYCGDAISDVWFDKD